MNNRTEDQDRFRIRKFLSSLLPSANIASDNVISKSQYELEKKVLADVIVDLENQGLNLEKKLVDEKVDLLDKINRVKQRKSYAGIFLTIAISWLIFVAFVIYGNSISLDRTTKLKFSISDRVVITLIVSSLFNVLTPTYIVAKYLFNQPNK